MTSIVGKGRRWLAVVLIIGVAGVGYWIWEEYFMPKIHVGDSAPAFSATTHADEKIALADFKGKRAVVLYFYPADNTSVCTTEACSFRDAYEDFVQAGAVVIGVSGDSLASHRDFAAGKQLPFYLISDSDGSLRKAFGVPSTLGLIPGRVTYVIDKEGVVRHIFNSQFNPRRHVEESLAIVRELSK